METKNPFSHITELKQFTPHLTKDASKERETFCAILDRAKTILPHHGAHLIFLDLLKGPVVYRADWVDGELSIEFYRNKARLLVAVAILRGTKREELRCLNMEVEFLAFNSATKDLEYSRTSGMRVTRTDTERVGLPKGSQLVLTPIKKAAPTGTPALPRAEPVRKPTLRPPATASAVPAPHVVGRIAIPRPAKKDPPRAIPASRMVRVMGADVPPVPPEPRSTLEAVRMVPDRTENFLLRHALHAHQGVEIVSTSQSEPRPRFEPEDTPLALPTLRPR